MLKFLELRDGREEGFFSFIDFVDLKGRKEAH
jgi:hypothetical protein